MTADFLYYFCNLFIIIIHYYIFVSLQTVNVCSYVNILYITFLSFLINSSVFRAPLYPQLRADGGKLL